MFTLCKIHLPEWQLLFTSSNTVKGKDNCCEADSNKLLQLSAYPEITRG